MGKIKKKSEYFAQLRKKNMENIENSKKPFAFFVILFVLAIALRIIIEPFSTKAILSAPLVFHYALTFIASFAMVALILSLLTKTNLKKTSKIVMLASPLIILGPVLDLIISGGKGFDLTYLYPDFAGDLITRFFTFGGAYSGYGATPGVQIEFAIFLVLIFFYVQIKTNSLRKSLAAAFFTYCLIFFFLITPFVLAPIFTYFDLTSSDFRNYLFAGYFLLWLVIFAIISFFKTRKELFVAVAQDLRLFRMAHAMIMFFAGAILGITLYQQNISFSFFSTIVFFPIALFFGIIYLIIQNNIYDYSIDKISNKCRPLQALPSYFRDYQLAGIISLAFSVAFGYVSGTVAFFGLICFILFYSCYSCPPLRLKRIPILSKVIISFSSLLIMLVGFISSGAVPSSFPLDLIILIMIGFTLAINFIDIKDYEGDKKGKINTLPVIFGQKKAKIIIGIFFIIAYIIGGFILKSPVLFLASLIFGLVEFYLVNKKNYNERDVFLVYLASFILLFYFYCKI